MTLWNQLLWGSINLSACLILEITILVWCASVLNRLSERFGKPYRRWQLALMLVVAIFIILGSHTAQVWIWSAAFVLVGAIADWNTSVYFSLATYTTLGYGDVVLGPALRIFAAFAAVTGLFGFGISTAFLVSAMSRLFSLDGQHSDSRN
ncbi:potassium channel family protein [Leisingera daeponensis]|uniref:Potassium channel family protein n=1 Tax=Leisingera daeponensis TaxID=405746 RepID=A0ABS7NAX6_9RHOB|nr:potassium channel family protein [Leisingera daeponensis]MBY6055423.1 potassium channel family protein [Leisingera daeponensis]MBY6138348.1 potassium channel family protein [Leisingera daeponensis]